MLDKFNRNSLHTQSKHATCKSDQIIDYVVVTPPKIQLSHLFMSDLNKSNMNLIVIIIKSTISR